ncbi:MAG: tyrosine-type recombinase/integrase [Melioribacteraceae bacterium]|nr:tyrosine-type recombinase/integrase [Melioribacteraceae bacterium]
MKNPTEEEPLFPLEQRKKLGLMFSSITSKSLNLKALKSNSANSKRTDLKYSEQLHSPSTTQAVKVIFNEFNSFFEFTYLDKITKLDTANYIMRKAKVSPHIAQKHLAHLRKAFNYAIELGILETNPFRDMKNFRTPERQPIFFSKEDFKKLLSVIEDIDFRDIVLFSLDTGMRRAEAVNLQWNQIDFEDKLIILDNREHLTKSKRIRSIPMNEEVYKILSERNKDNVFVFTRNNERFKLDFTTKKFKKYVKKAKTKGEL